MSHLPPTPPTNLPDVNANFLLRAAYASSTYTSYSKAVKSFTQFCSLFNLPTATTQQLDRTFTIYFHWLYTSNNGRKRQQAVDALYGAIALVPRLRRCLPEAQLSLRGWSKLQPSKSHPPLTYPLAGLIACRMVVMGKMREAIGTLVAFEAFLRVSELANLRVVDILDASDSHTSGIDVMVIRIETAKTGTNQSARIKDPCLRRLLRLFTAVLRPGDHLLTCSANAYRTLFHKATASLGLSLRYVPHSLRHGGATRAYLQGWSIADIMLQGRWTSTKTAVKYIQSGPALLASTQVPQPVSDLSKLLVADVESSLQYCHSSLKQKH